MRNPVYDRYLGTNRHILTPDGWVHIQDNMKMSGRAGSEPIAIVQEDVINTYDRSTSYSPQAGICCAETVPRFSLSAYPHQPRPARDATRFAALWQTVHPVRAIILPT